MNRQSGQILAGACVTALLLASCGGSGGGGSLTSTFAPAQTLQAVVSIAAVVGGTPMVGSPGTYPLKITATGSNGTIISGTYATPISLTDSDASGATRLSATTLTGSSTAVSLIYNGMGGSSLGGFNGATITATSGPASGAVAFLSNTCVTLKGIRGYYPCDLQNAYSLPGASAGVGQTVALVDAFDDPTAEADLGVYRSEFGLPACTTANGCFRKVNGRGVQGNYPPPDFSGWATESSLDMDMVSAVCPNCHIILVEADSNDNADLYGGVDEAVALGATQVSNSYAETEYPGELAEDVHFNHPGVNITASSGDGDYAGTTGAGVLYPASSPYVTSVGGTNLTVAPTGRGWNEIVWNNENIQGGGSGCSLFEPKPAWQTDTGCANRTYADVSAVGDPFSGLAVYDSWVSGRAPGGWFVVGGTSASAPIIAGVYALGGGSSLNAGSSSYDHLASLNNVTSGANGGCAISAAYLCTAGVGYNGPTGNGTPIGVGAFGGGSSLAPAFVHHQGAWRHVLQAPPGTLTYRACADATAGHPQCLAIIVPPLKP